MSVYEIDISEIGDLIKGLNVVIANLGSGNNNSGLSYGPAAVDLGTGLLDVLGDIAALRNGWSDPLKITNERLLRMMATILFESVEADAQPQTPSPYPRGDKW